MGGLWSACLSEFSEYPHPETSAWTGHRLSLIANYSDGSDCPTIGPECECCRCIGQALSCSFVNSQTTYETFFFCDVISGGIKLTDRYVYFQVVYSSGASRSAES